MPPEPNLCSFIKNLVYRTPYVCYRTVKCRQRAAYFSEIDKVLK